jgi:hypothetical protein
VLQLGDMYPSSCMRGYCLQACFTQDRLLRAAIAEHHMTHEAIMLMKKLGTVQLPSGRIVELIKATP